MTVLDQIDLEAAIEKAQKTYDRARIAERLAWSKLSELLDQQRANEPPKDPNALTLLQRLDALFPLSPYTIKAYLREGGLNARNWFRSASTEELEAFGYTNRWGRRQYHTCVFCGKCIVSNAMGNATHMKMHVKQGLLRDRFGVYTLAD